MFLLIIVDEKQSNSRRSNASSSSTISTNAIINIVDRLKMERVRNSTKSNYYGIWKTFNEFYVRLDIKPPTWEERLILFAGF